MAATLDVCETGTATSATRNDKLFEHPDAEIFAEAAKRKLNFSGIRMGPLSERELLLCMETLGLASAPPSVPDLATLNRIIAAMLENIPFQGIDPFVGDNPLLDDEYVFRKLIEQRRGGYCVELNNILGRLLLTLGYRFHIRAARIRWGRPLDTPLTPIGHMLMCVDLGPEGEFFVDVGFGGPNPFQALPVQGELDPYRIRRLDDAGTIEVAIKTTGRAGASTSWRPIHPRSLFRHILMVGRFVDGAWLTLVDGRFCRRSRSGQVEQRQLTSVDEVLRILEEEFVIKISPDIEPKLLRDRIQSVL
ncbi:arylamine N-acetyltransferase-like [Haemaphysalis longicornis]